MGIACTANGVIHKIFGWRPFASASLIGKEGGKGVVPDGECRLSIMNARGNRRFLVSWKCSEIIDFRRPENFVFMVSDFHDLRGRSPFDNDSRAFEAAKHLR